MPDLSFRITGVEAVARGLVPLLEFQLEVTSQPEAELVRAVLLQAQIQIQCPRRAYAAVEQERLSELFGTPDRWGQTLRNRLWTHVHATVPPFAGRAEVALPVPCTYDLNIAAAKYFAALEDGEVSLLFLFSGTIFHAGEDGRLQVQRVSWEKECAYSLPVHTWRELMEQHYPNSAWLYLHRDVFARLLEYRRRHALPSWEDTVERLLAAAAEEVPA